MATALRRMLIGRPIASERASHEKLPKILALPVFASDALSSVAYATGEIMAALLLAGTGVLHLTIPISIAIGVLLVIVTTSYRQTVLAYPGGGGAYIVARDNLGIIPAQIAGASLLIDYILTVAVSVTAGVDAIQSLWLTKFGTHIPVVPVCVIAVVLITLVNLRGVKESGAIFALPTYCFIGIVGVVISIGAWHFFHGTLPLAQPASVYAAARSEETHGVALAGTMGLAGVMLLLRAFASGCAALTGVEAISNGVTAFQEPSAKNAATTMVWMSAILGVMFFGLSFLAVHVHALPETTLGLSRETVISQVGRTVLGRGGAYIFLQAATALILVLAANTSFADFPRLSALIAKDGFLPKQLANVGDRLVFDRGIIALGFLACLLIAYKHGDTHSLIPLYAVGVFLSFTLSQAGMVRRWFRLQSPAWHLRAFVNGLGAVVTFIVLWVFIIVKFVHGAWLVTVLIPILVVIFFRIHAHYASVKKQLSAGLMKCLDDRARRHIVLVLVPSVTRGALEAVDYARSLAGDCRAVHIEVDPSGTPAFRSDWEEHCSPVPVVILESPYRNLVDPLMEYLDEVQLETPDARVTVVIPEFAPPRWWQNLLHGHTGLVLKIALLNRKNVVVTNVRYHLEDEHITMEDLFNVK